MNFINIFDVNNDQSYPPKVLKNEHFSGLIIIKGRVQAKRAFFSFLDLKTSFLAYICILGQIKKKC